MQKLRVKKMELAIILNAFCQSITPSEAGIKNHYQTKMMTQIIYLNLVQWNPYVALMNLASVGSLDQVQMIQIWHISCIPKQSCIQIYVIPAQSLGSAAWTLMLKVINKTFQVAMKHHLVHQYQAKSDEKQF